MQRESSVIQGGCHPEASASSLEGPYEARSAPQQRARTRILHGEWHSSRLRRGLPPTYVSLARLSPRSG